MRRYVFAYDVNTDTIQARRSFDDWVTILRDDDPELGIESWDDVYSIVLDRYIYGGDFSEFVSEADVDFPEEDL